MSQNGLFLLLNFYMLIAKKALDAFNKSVRQSVGKFFLCLIWQKRNEIKQR